MTLFSIAAFCLLIGLCFWVPSTLAFPDYANWKGAKRFLAGASLIAVGLSITYAAYLSFGGMPLSINGFLRDLAFLWIGSATFWVPLLIIRIFQLYSRERRVMDVRN